MVKEILQIRTKKLKPDPKQPRVYKDKEHIRQLAVSIKNKGVINPIEIDKDFVIITGEMRWRAAMEAGLEEVPCKILDISPNERFMRQLHENIHHNTMSAWDMAMALKKARGILLKEGEKYNQSLFAREFGKSRGWLRDYDSIIKDSGIVAETAKATNDLSSVREVATSPKEFKRYIFGLVKKHIPRKQIYLVKRALIESLRRGDSEAIEKILAMDFTDKMVLQVNDMLRRVAPEPLKDIEEAQSAIQDTAIRLVKLLEEYPGILFGKVYSITVLPYLLQVSNTVGRHIEEKDNNALLVKVNGEKKLLHGKKEQEA